ncbi:MAG: invasion associated locus B family protein [Hyphomicrobium sp.]
MQTHISAWRDQAKRTTGGLCTVAIIASLAASFLSGSAAPLHAGGAGESPPPAATPAGTPPPPPASDPADGVVRGQHGDWQIVCKPPPAGAKNEVCALVQSVTAQDRNNVGLTIYFQRFSNGTQVLRVFAPLGVLLPPGVGLKIDDVDVGHAPFHRCQSFACYAQVTVDGKLLGQLSTGKTAIFIIFQTEEAGIGIPISLSGFSDAVAGLN